MIDRAVLFTVSHFLQSQIFLDEVGAYPSKAYLGHLTLPTNIGLGRKGITSTNSLAYYGE